MNKTKQYRIIYWAILAGIVTLGIILEFIDVFDGIIESGTTFEFMSQYVMILVTLGAIYLALKMIKKNPVLRMAILEGPAFINLILYHGFVNASFGYLAIMCLIAYAFIYPSKQEDEDTPNE